MGPEILLGLQERHLAPEKGERAGAGEPDHPSADHDSVQLLDRHTVNLPPASGVPETKGSARHLMTRICSALRARRPGSRLLDFRGWAR